MKLDTCILQSACPNYVYGVPGRAIENYVCEWDAGKKIGKLILHHVLHPHSL